MRFALLACLLGAATTYQVGVAGAARPKFSARRASLAVALAACVIKVVGVGAVAATR